ncbi:MAG: DUF4212 domain-containing protein [Bacteroidota bacterium]
MDNLKKYWRTNLMYMGILLTIWFIASYGLGILAHDFWWAQQGSIYVFVAIIFVYVVLMNRLDKKYNVDE